MKLKKDDITMFKDSFKGLTRDYMFDCINNNNIQENWIPHEGDIIVGTTGNIFVISGSHSLVAELGGDVYFFGGGYCVRDGGRILNGTYCYTMNKSGKWYTWDEKGKIIEKENPWHFSFSNFKYVPYPHELKGDLK